MSVKNGSEKCQGKCQEKIAVQNSSEKFKNGSEKWQENIAGKNGREKWQ